jgi:hypothetical protein
MFYDLIYSAMISVAGANLFLLVDRYERSHMVAGLAVRVECGDHA